ncbi:HD-GYP domain-containing protein [Clostridium ganghwense]|uniref:HD domain-containing protein n=1 Tax=Clostridium ganghwense TaxID=312089 RepID=A0ABT4CRV8_9CLOT|nr:HD domain-containing phosphohydrolase [Clostridium ganghwense]MCY6371796.1 HD domain-containing protein [Clostridium ganghwense]
MSELRFSLKNDFKVIKNESLNLETVLHSKRVAIYAKQLAQQMNYTSKQINYLVLAALNHDIGKCKIPQHVLNKKGRLTQQEYELVKNHAKYGSNILTKYKFSNDFCNIVKFHHENFDGSGYYGVVGNKIPITSRIIHIVDVYDALISNRCYRKAYTKEKALEIIENERDTYDPYIFHVFMKIMDKDL